jgi:hypothetical protein
MAELVEFLAENFEKKNMGVAYICTNKLSETYKE